jgi:predicted aminopeptidase
MGEIDSRPDTELYYERRERLLQKVAQSQSQKQTPAQRKKYQEENKAFLNFVGFSKNVERRLKRLYARRRQIAELRAARPEMALKFAEEEMKIQDTIDQVIKEFNKKYDASIGKNK